MDDIRLSREILRAVHDPDPLRVGLEGRQSEPEIAIETPRVRVRRVRPLPLERTAVATLTLVAYRLHNCGGSECACG